MYAVVLGYGRRPEAQGIHASHGYVLDRLVNELRGLQPTVNRAGTSDLVLLGTDGVESACKFSGNSLRVKRTHFLYHGTLLYDFDLSLIAGCLRMAPRQPEYRRQRPHGEFVANLPLDRSTLTAAIEKAWPEAEEIMKWPNQRVEHLVRDRYRLDAWNLAL